jgi:hypothetical protein
MYEPGTVVLAEGVMFTVTYAQLSGTGWLYKSEKVGIEAYESDITHILEDEGWQAV